MRIGKFLYYGDFVVIPIAVLWLGAAAYVAGGCGAIPEWSLSLLFGAALWTLVEYLIHRYAYHHAPILSPLHDAHHQAPRAFVGVPSFLSSGSDPRRLLSAAARRRRRCSPPASPAA